MKFLLVAINAKYIHSNLGVYSLKAYGGQEAEGLGQEIEIGEYTINHSRQSILADIYRRRPDVVGFSCYIWNMEYVSAILFDLPKLLPRAKIWLGGPEVSYDGPEILERFPQAAGVMAGEGEETFAQLIRFYGQGEKEEEKKEEEDGEKDGEGEKGGEKDGEGEKGGEKDGGRVSLKDILGIVYRKPGRPSQICVNPPRPPMELNRLPFPYRELKEEDWAHRILYYESSRGCPYSCSYCLSSIDRAVRFRDLEKVKQELQFFLDRNVSQVKFVDRTFNCRKFHAMEIWNYILEHDNGVTNFHFEIAGDLLDEEEIALFSKMRPGLIQLEIGVQSANPKTIAAIRRKMDLEKVGRMAARVREGRNIHQHLDLIAGLPWEDLESFKDSFDVVYRMKPDNLQLGFLKVLKGSFMEQQREEYGLQAGALPPYEVLSTKWLCFSDILKLKQIEEMVEVYYNSGQFTQSVKRLEQLAPRPVWMFEELAGWHESRRLWDVKHSRQARYEIFWEWVSSRFPGEAEEFRDLLTVDFYLREKAKSRPGFSRDLKGMGEAFRRFYQAEAKDRKLLPEYVGYDSRQLAHMTHIEVQRDGRAFLFDYRKRDPLSYNAAMFEISLSEA